MTCSEYKVCQASGVRSYASIEMARKLELPSGNILVFDMSYYDFLWWNKLDSNNTWFVTRAKGNLAYEVIENIDL